MAFLEKDPSSGRYRVRFRYGGRAFKRSLRTKQHRVAMATLGQVEETLRLVHLGLCEVPPNVDPGAFMVSGGRARQERSPRSPVVSLKDLFKVYERELPPGAKEAKTLEGEAIHKRHLLRHLGSSTRIAGLTKSDVQKYVEARSKDEFNGRRVGPFTIKKELSTLRLVWNWAVIRILI